MTNERIDARAAEKGLGTCVLDREAVRALVTGDVVLLQELIGFFLEDYPPLLTEMETAIQRESPAGLKQAAHALRGMVSNFHAGVAFAAAAKLEAIAASANLAGAADAYTELEDAIARLKPALADLIQQAASGTWTRDDLQPRFAEPRGSANRG
jgi:HPt (histidine-containing phosphotransfer) domain-containing protein